MARGKASVNKAELNRQLQRISSQASERAAHNLKQKIQEEIVKSGRIDTGEMINRIDVENVADAPKEARWAVKPKTKQFLFQDQGTKGTPPRPGQVLRFKPSGSGVFIFRKSAGPIPAAHFLRKAIARMSPRDWE